MNLPFCILYYAVENMFDKKKQKLLFIHEVFSWKKVLSSSQITFSLASPSCSRAAISSSSSDLTWK